MKKLPTLVKKEKPLFKIELQPTIPEFPDVPKHKVNIRYPLIAPYSYAHIFWDNKSKELIYYVEEPVLNPEEKNILNLLEEGIKELINISYLNVKKGETLIVYLEKNLKVLLNELRIEVSKDSYLKLMYFIYRDFVGLNEVEPLLCDYFIEDIECNGVGLPIYIVHRKYRNVRTNVEFDSTHQLASFVEKLAQKCGQYVSYANPLLDGALPDGSRVNATFTEDISSRGPTFTIRKFTRNPWTPTQLMYLRTASPEILAYLWLLTEYERNIMVIGGTGSGKTTFLNGLIFFIPPSARVVSIEDSVTGDSKIIIKQKNKIKNITIKEFVDNKIDAEVMTLNEKGKIIFTKPSSYIKHKVKKEIYEILTSTGRRINVTKDHSLFTLKNKKVTEIKPIELQQGKSFIAVPRILPLEGEEIKEINLLNHLNHFNDCFLLGEPIKKVFEKYKLNDFGIKKERYAWWKKHNLIKIKYFKELNINFTDEELKQLKIKSKNTSSIPLIFKITEKFLEFCGLWVGDGSYDNHNRNSVIISNTDQECRDIFENIKNYIGANHSEMNDNGVSQRIHSTVFYKFMKKVLKFDGYSSTKKIPEFIFNLSNNQIKYFIRGYFSADGTMKSNEVSCSSQSIGLLNDLQTLFLRLGIISRINDFNRKDKCINMSISSSENIEKFKEIRFLQERKNKNLDLYNKQSHHTSSDIIPLEIKHLKDINENHYKLSWPYLQGMQNIGRSYLQKIAIPGSEYNDISHTDILWDKVKKITKLETKEIEVFDLSIPKYEKFLCNNIFVHNTRELNLEHSNWLPSVAREGVGLSNILGQKYGEVSLFTLLRESFRQNPDYVIVGEVRGKEAYVLFQGMASGHPSFGTMHANSVDTMIKRLETHPINLSPSLVETMDVVAVMTHAKVKGKEVRRIRELVEVIAVGEKGDSTINKIFVWNPQTDSFMFNGNSHVFKKLTIQHGVSEAELNAELDRRSKLLIKLYQNRIFDFHAVQMVINEYYKDPKAVLAKFGVT